MKRIVILPLLLIILNLSARASLAITISDVRDSNHTSAAIAISWITDTPTSANEVHYGKTTALGLTATDTVLDDVHSVVIGSLETETTYFYEVSSGGQVDNKGGVYYTFKTAQVGFGNVHTLFGFAFKIDGTPAERTIVYVTVTNGNVTSARLSNLTDSTGVWSVELGNLKNLTTGAAYIWNVGDTINVFAQGAADGSASLTDIVNASNPQQIGDMSLPVQLSFFIAIPKNDGIILKWTTESEINNVGWNVYKSERKNGEYKKINITVIKGAGTSATPFNYQYFDAEVIKGRTYYYYLEDIDFNGNKSISPIVRAVAGKPTDWVDKALITWGKIKRAIGFSP